MTLDRIYMPECRINPLLGTVKVIERSDSRDGPWFGLKTQRAGRRSFMESVRTRRMWPVRLTFFR